MNTAQIDALPPIGTYTRRAGARGIRSAGHQNAQVAIRFPDDLLRDINKLAVKAQLPFAEIVRRLCVKALTE